MTPFYAAMLIDWHPIVQTLLQAAAVAIATLITVLTALLVKKINGSNARAAQKEVLSRVTGVIGAVVTEIFQTSVDAARKAVGQNGALPKEVAEAAIAQALEKTKSYLSAVDMKAIASLFGLDTPEKIDAFLTTNIEATIRLFKPNPGGVSTPPAGFNR